MKEPRGEPPTKTTGSLHGWGRSTVVLMVESPAVLAGKPVLMTFVTVPFGERQLTAAWNVLIGLIPACTTIRPCTVTETLPWRSTSPLPEMIDHAAPPPAMPRSVTGGWPTGVIESNSVKVPPSCAPALTVPAPTSVRAPIAATINFRPTICPPPNP